MMNFSTTSNTVVTFSHPGTKRQSNQFTCKVTLRPCGRIDSVFFSATNERFRSMAQVARYLNLAAAPIQQEKIELEKLASYLVERGGMSQLLFIAFSDDDHFYLTLFSSIKEQRDRVISSSAKLL